MTINKKRNRQKEKQKNITHYFTKKKKKRWSEDAQQGETGSIPYETKD